MKGKLMITNTRIDSTNTNIDTDANTAKSTDAAEYKAESHTTNHPGQPRKDVVRISCSKDIARICASNGAYNPNQEIMTVLYMNNKNEVLNVSTLTIGVVNECLVRPADVLRTAITTDSCVNVAMCHNHPAGDCLPSLEDVELTKRMIDACKLVGFVLLDHLVIGDKDGSEYVSIRDMGMCNFNRV